MERAMGAQDHPRLSGNKRTRRARQQYFPEPRDGVVDPTMRPGQLPYPRNKFVQGHTMALAKSDMLGVYAVAGQRKHDKHIGSNPEPCDGRLFWRKSRLNRSDRQIRKSRAFFPSRFCDSAQV